MTLARGPGTSAGGTLSATRWLHDRGQTALHWAAYCCHLPIVELLVRVGAVLDVQEMDGRGTWLGMLTLGRSEPNTGERRVQHEYETLGTRLGALESFGSSFHNQLASHH